MYVPKTVYENAPYYWIVLGVLLIGFGAFYGQAGDMKFLLAGIGGGMFALIWGLVVLRHRLAQESRKPCSTYDEYLDQTMELDLRKLQAASREAPAETPVPE